MKLLLRLLLMKSYWVCVSEESSLPNSYPDPTTESGSVECGVPTQGTLCDPDHLLTTTDQESVISLLKAAQTEILCPCGNDRCTEESVGFVIGVYVGKNLQYAGYSLRDSLLHIDSSLLKTDWSSHSECKNQIVLILSVQQSQSHLALEGIAEGYLLKREEKRIVDLINTHMSQGALTFAINAGINQTVEMLKLKPQFEDATMLMLMGIFGGICLVTCLLSLSAAYMMKLTARNY